MFVRKSSYALLGADKEYELTFDNPALCDILMIGGGGGGATDRAGGGGAGSLLFYKNFVMKGTYKIKLAKVEKVVVIQVVIMMVIMDMIPKY